MHLVSLICGGKSAGVVVGVGVAVGVLIAAGGGGVPALLAHREASRLRVEAQRLSVLQREALAAHERDRAALELVLAELPEGAAERELVRDVHGAVGLIVGGAEEAGLSVGQVDIGERGADGGAVIRLETRGSAGAIVGMLEMLAAELPSVTVQSLRASVGQAETAGASFALVWNGSESESME